MYSAEEMNNEEVNEPTNVLAWDRWRSHGTSLSPFTDHPSVCPEGEPPVGRCFLGICTDHGDVWGQNHYPSEDLLSARQNYAGRDIRYGQLPSQPDADGHVVWSAVYRASANRMTPDLASKFNVLRGLDIPYYIGHHWGGHLGNFAGTVNNTTAGSAILST